MNAFDSIAPPDKADSAAVTAPLVAFLEALHLPAGHRAELTLTLGDVEWRAIRRQFQRPYQKVPQSEFALYLPMGVVWVQRRDEHEEAPATPAPFLPRCDACAEGRCEDCPKSTGLTSNCQCRNAHPPAWADPGKAPLVRVARPAEVDAPPPAPPSMAEREAPRLTEAQYGGVWTAPEGS